LEQQQNVPMKVTVYSITYNQCEIVSRTIRGLFNQDYPQDHYEIVVLDDGSNDDTLRTLNGLAQQSPVPLRVIACDHEADYLSARRWNQCLAAASPQTAVFIQIDDVRLRPDFIRQHIKWHAQGPQFIVTGAKFEGPTETWDLKACRRGRLAGPGGVAAEVEVFTAVWGASLSFPRTLMEKVSQPPFEMPYDERMTGWGFHEVECAYRMKKAGARIIYDPAAGVFHQDHTAETEARRGLSRDKLVSKGIESNEQYLLKKHGLDKLPRW
jgi:glycosyltransferase involved in cell wall biosynthesis